MWTLRVSVTDQCSYRCRYCQPARAQAARARLSTRDYATMAPALARLGVSKVRFTGGEPLQRPDLPGIVREFRAAMPSAMLAVTTNGLLLGACLAELHGAGLSSATVHVDTLRPERYRDLMGGRRLDAVLGATLAARSVLDEVKLNVVVQRGRNDDELFDFLAFSEEHRVEVRFIELMDTGIAAAYAHDAFVSGAEIVERLGATPLGRPDPCAPAERWSTCGGVAFGVIASASAPFCDRCNRLRLSCDGTLRGCLYEPGTVSLADTEAGELDAVVTHVVNHKKSHHPSRRSLHVFSMAESGG
ncbi:MAG: radical SAM protein [Myxococcales bacterium]|nr:radical SAM protein [Myxococcales bacterium]